MNYQQKLQHNVGTNSLNFAKTTPNIQPNSLKGQGNESMHSIKGNEKFNQKHMKELMQQMRFKQKMQAINKKKGKYKRSTNNCHKKYIGILKNLLFLKLSAQKKNEILSEFIQYRNSRVYYFIILCYLKWYLDAMDIRWIFQHFCQEVEAKVNRFRLEINTTNNPNFLRFRKDQIIELEYALQAVNYFLRGFTEEAIRVLYQKNKYIIIKRNQYLRTLQIIKGLDANIQKQLRHASLEEKLARLHLEEVHRWNKDLSFHDLESMERLTKIKQNQEEKESSNSESGSNEEQQYEARLLYKQSKQILPSDNKKIEKGVKMQQIQYDTAVKYPLLGLQNSYKIITQANWYSWIIQKQKTLQFSIQKREGELVRNAQSKGLQFQRSFLFNNIWGISHYEKLH